MNTLRLFGWLSVLWAMTSVGFAQPRKPSKPDIIVKTDDSRIVVRVIGVDASVIRYRKLNEQLIRQISKLLVWKIIYASGVVRVITPPAKPDRPVENTPDTDPANSETTLIPDQNAELDKILLDLEKDISVHGRKIRLHPIFFDMGSTTVLPQSYAYLDSIAFFLIKIPTIKVEVGGHTDNTGGPTVNNPLSQRRADAVRNYLVTRKNIAAYRITAHGYGQLEPVASNQTERGKTLNRRVELKFLESGKETYVIRLKNGQRILATFVIVSANNKTVTYRQQPNTPLVRVAAADVSYIEYPDRTRRPVNSGAGKEYDGKDEQENSSPPSSTIPSKKFTIQINGLPAYMINQSRWISLPDGYGHTIGGGGSIQFDYWLTKRISVGAELVYAAWSTKINVVEQSGEVPYYIYYTKAGQYGVLAHVRLGIGKHFYLMPQAGANQLSVSVYDATNNVSFSGTQISYGGTLGYLIPLGRTLNVDMGLFYQIAAGTETLKTNHGVDPMHYAGVRIGLGFSH